MLSLCKIFSVCYRSEINNFAASQLAQTQVKREGDHVRNVLSVQSMVVRFDLYFITLRINVAYLVFIISSSTCSISPHVPPHQVYTSIVVFICPCVCFCWVSLCLFLFLGFLVLLCFCSVIQFESTRSSSPTECCRFSPWSRKVVSLPPSLLTPVCSL